jgi:hypothetical protein
VIGGTWILSLDIVTSILISSLRPSFFNHNHTSVTEPTRSVGHVLTQSTVDEIDAEQSRRDRKALNGLGEILVCVHRSYETDIPESYYVQKPLESVTEMSEKALKGQAISHGIT